MNRSPDSHFYSHHFHGGSSFVSQFPVDTADKRIRDIVSTSLPQTLDEIFMFRSGAETLETIAHSGALPLAPLSAEIDTATNDKTLVEQAASDEFIRSALLEGKAMTDFHLQIDKECGALLDFSLFTRQADDKENVVYGLRGSLEHDGEQSVYELERYTPDTPPTYLPVDESIAAAFIRALEKQHTRNITTGDMSTRLLRLIGASKDVMQKQTESIDIRNDLEVTVDREQRIVRGIGKLTTYHVSMSEILKITSRENTPIRINRYFDLFYDDKLSPPYAAKLGALLIDDGLTMPQTARDSYFEQLSTNLRNHPVEVFESLDDATQRAARIARSDLLG